MIRSDGKIPPHFESRTFKRSAVPPLDRRDGVGIPAQRLVEHDGNAQPRPKLRQAIDLGVRHRLLEGRRSESP